LKDSPKNYMNPYKYKKQKINANVRLKNKNSRWLRYEVSFPTAFRIYDQPCDIRGEYFLPRNAKNVPLAIVVHGWGDRSAIPCHLLASSFIKKGYAVFIFYLVFHTKRMPEILAGHMPYLNTEDWFEGYRASVIELQQVVDWAYTRPELDKDRIAILGISLGGFISEIVMSLDRRIKAGVFMVAGGNSEIVTWNTKSEAIVVGHGCTRKECRDIRSGYPQYLAEVNEKGVDNVVPFCHCYLTDSLTFASGLRQRPVLMLNAKRDKTIPQAATNEFWQACGRPNIKWLPGSHITFWLWYPRIAGEITRFLATTFSDSAK